LLYILKEIEFEITDINIKKFKKLSTFSKDIFKKYFEEKNEENAFKLLLELKKK